MSTADWTHVSAKNRCPACGRADWCKLATDGSAAFCRRSPEGPLGPGREYHDCHGEPFWIHRLGPDAEPRELPEASKPGAEPPPAAEPDVLNRVYRALLAELALDAPHRENLQARGLSGDDVEAGLFRTWHLRGRARLAKKLVEQFGEEVARQVPGLFVQRDERDENRTWWSLAGSPGLLMPALDASGRVLGLRVRRDEVDADSGDRYSWVSSCRYGGPRPATSLHVPPGQRGSVVRLTEGELKATVATVQTGVLTVGVAGVGRWREALPVLAELGAERVLLAFDADCRENPVVARATVSAVRGLREAGFEVAVETWPAEAGKGVDDALQAGAELEVLEAEALEQFLAELEAVAPVSRGNVVPLRRRADAPATSGALALAPGAEPNHALPRIVRSGDLSRMTAESLAALQAANAAEPTVFAQDGNPVRLELREDGARLVPLDKAALRGHLDRCAEWVEVRKNNGAPEVHRVFPPAAVVEDILALPAAERRFPPIRRITRAPVFGADGALLDTPGYHASEATYYVPSGLEVPPVPERPTREQVDAARELFLANLLSDFPFTSDASRAHALAAALLPFCRALVAGPTPNHLADAPTEGTGKTLLLKVLAGVFLGDDRMGLLTPAPPKDSEWPKRILAVLRNGPPVILLDNVEGKLDSPALAQVLTLDYHEERELGASRTIRVPNLSTWFTTGNNVTLSRELARRTVLIRLDAERENPEERTGFRHPDLPKWARANRGRLVHACLVLIRAWLAAGSPKWKPGPNTVKIGSFESWCEVLGGILDVAGVPGFLQNRQETKARAGEVDAEWGRFFDEWAARFGLGTPVAVRELFPLVEEGHLLGVVDGKTDRARQTKLGAALRGRVGRVYHGVRLVKYPEDDRKGGARYFLQAVQVPPDGTLPNLCRTSETRGSAPGSAPSNADSIGYSEDVPNLPNLHGYPAREEEKSSSYGSACREKYKDTPIGSAGSANTGSAPSNGGSSVPNLRAEVRQGSAEVRHLEQEELVEELL